MVIYQVLTKNKNNSVSDNFIAYVIAFNIFFFPMLSGCIKWPVKISSMIIFLTEILLGITNKVYSTMLKIVNSSNLEEQRIVEKKKCYQKYIDGTVE